MIALLLIVGGYFWFMRINLLEHYLTKEFQAPVHINNVVFSFHEVIIDGLRIENTFKTAQSDALKISRIVIQMNPLSLLKKHVNMDRVRVLRLVFGLELFNNDGSENNWSSLVQNSVKRKTSKTFTINRLELFEILIDAHDVQGNLISIWPIPYLEVFDIGKPTPLSFGEALTIISRTIFDHFISPIPMAPLQHSLLFSEPSFKETPRDRPLTTP